MTFVTEQGNKRSPEQLQAEVEVARADLVASLGQLREQTTPTALVDRAKSKVSAFFLDEYGGVRPERVAIAAGAVVAVVVMGRWRRRRRSR